MERDEDGKQPREQGHCPVLGAPIQSLGYTITFYPWLEEEGRNSERNPLSCFLDGHNTALGSKHIFL